VNQVGTFLGIRSVVEPMKIAGGGSIVNTSSSVSLRTQNSMIAYIASKWAIRGMTKASALELGRYGIRVNSIHPGGIDTAMGNPQEIARLVLFLASDDSSFSTGSEFIADGSWSAGEIIDLLPNS